MMYGYSSTTMSKNIAVSDEVYRRRKREKGDRSFSEVIADLLDARSRLDKVMGQGVFDAEAIESARRDIEDLSHATLARLDDEAR